MKTGIQNITEYGVLLLSLFVLLAPKVSAQVQDNPGKVQKEVRELLEEAEAAADEGDFASAEASYRRAISKDPSHTVAKYNMGNLYYNKEKSSQAENRLKQAAEVAETKGERHKIFHNLGNAYMKQKEYQQAVEAYKNALRNKPDDDETRYNLALAKKMLEEEQQNQEDQEDDSDGGGEDDQEQDQKQDQQDQDGEGGEDQEQEGEPGDEGEDQEDESQGDKGDEEQQDEGDQQEGEQDQREEEGQQQPQPAQGQLSPEQIQSLLEAMNNEERKVQDKINAEKVKGAKVDSEKDW